MKIEFAWPLICSLLEEGELHFINLYKIIPVYTAFTLFGASSLLSVSKGNTPSIVSVMSKLLWSLVSDSECGDLIGRTSEKLCTELGSAAATDACFDWSLLGTHSFVR